MQKLWLFKSQHSTVVQKINVISVFPMDEYIEARFVIYEVDDCARKN